MNTESFDIQNKLYYDNTNHREEVLKLNKIIAFTEIPSTNDYIKEHFVELDDQTIIVSRTQTRGRGRLDHSWESPDGNLYMSLLLKKGINRDDIFNQLMKISLAITSLLESYGIEASIKYPNDILVNKKKIAGILIESKGSDKLEYLIIGVGLNVNQIDFGDLEYKATSINRECGKTLSIEQVMKDLNELYNTIRSSREWYIKKSIVIGKNILYKNILYKVLNIDENGSLVLKNGAEIISPSINEINLEEIYDEVNN